MSELENIVLYNPSMPEELKGEALKKNSESLARVANNRAVNILANIDTSAQVGPYQSANYAPISSDFIKSFYCSGGAIDINVAACISTVESYAIFAAICVDGNIKAESIFYPAGGNLRWIGTLSKGSRKLEIKWASAGNIYLNLAATRVQKSTLQVVEYII